MKLSIIILFAFQLCQIIFQMLLSIFFIIPGIVLSKDAVVKEASLHTEKYHPTADEVEKKLWVVITE